MTTTVTFGLGSALLLLTAAFTGRVAPAGEEQPSFLGEVHGALTATPRGEATFGTIPAVDGRPGFALSLGARGQNGAVLFSRASGTRLSIGSYEVSARADGADDIRALVVTGPPTQPTGVFQAERGELVVTSVSDSTIRGFFRLEATGFVASEAPDREDRTVTGRHLRRDGPLRPAPARRIEPAARLTGP